MRIQSSQLQRTPMMAAQAKPQASAPAESSTAALPTDEFTFSGDNPGKFFLGMGVMMTGMMFGAQMGTSMAPVVMMGSMFGGMAIMFS